MTGLNDRLALAVEVDCTFPAVSGSELLTRHYHCTALTLPHKHTVHRVIVGDVLDETCLKVPYSFCNTQLIAFLPKHHNGHSLVQSAVQVEFRIRKL